MIDLTCDQADILTHSALYLCIQVSPMLLPLTLPRGWSQKMTVLLSLTRRRLSVLMTLGIMDFLVSPFFKVPFSKSICIFHKSYTD